MHNIKEYILDKLTPEIIQEMQKIWFTADLHHGHPGIVKFANRPIDVKDHENWLVEEVYNKYIGKKDEVYILGDVSFASKIEAQKFIAKLNGNKHLILGNHDKNIRNLGNFVSISQIKDFTYSRHGINIHIVLCHYPISSWNRKIHGSWHLYGHVHGRYKNTGMSWDVGMDNSIGMNDKGNRGVDNLHKPINLYDICRLMHYKQLAGHDKIDNTEIAV